MVQKLEKNIFLFLHVLEGRVDKADFGLHDVRWLVGSKLMIH